MKLPTYEDQGGYRNPNNGGARLQNAPQVDVSGNDFGARNWAEVGKLGQQIQQAAGQVGHIYDDYNTTKANEAANTFQREFLAWQSEASQKKGKFGQDVGTEYTQWSQKRLEALGKDLNKVQKGRFMGMAQDSMATQQRWAADYGNGERRSYQFETNSVKKQTAADTMYANIGDPEMVDKGKESIRQAVFDDSRMHGWDADTTIAKTAEAVDNALVPAIADRIKAGDTGLAAALMEHHAPDINPKSRVQLGTMLNQECERQVAKAQWERDRAEARAEAVRNKAMREVAKNERNAKELAEFKGDTTQLQEMSAQYRALGVEDKAQELDADIAFWKSNRAAARFATIESLPEVEAGMGALVKILQNTDNLSIDEIKRIQGSLKAMKTVYDKRASGYQSDPAQAAQALVEIPDDFSPEARAGALLDQQAKDGVAPRERRVLTKQETAQFSTALIDAQDPAGDLQMLSQQYGEHWPAVEHQLVTDGKLPAWLSVAASGMDKKPTSLLAQAAKDKDFQKNAEKALVLSGATKTEFQTIIGEELEDLSLTLRAQGNLGLESNLSEATQVLAMQYMLSGDSMKSAASRAANDVVLNRYRMNDSYRVPLKHDADGIDVGAQIELSRIASSAVDMMALPSATVLGDEHVAGRLGSALRRDGKWITAPDESGLMLFLGTDAVRGKDGQPIVRTWGELAKAGQQVANEQASAFSSFGF